MKPSSSFVSAFLGLTLVAMGFAGAAEMPKSVRVGGFSAFYYWFAKKMVMDVDKLLAKQGIVAEFCTFRQTQPAKDFSYRGAGPCLFKNFKASMKTEALAGNTYVWIKDGKEQYHALEIQWRPPQGGWMQLMEQYFKMKFEFASFGAKPSYKEFIGGDLKIILPESADGMEALVKNGSPWARDYLANVSTVTLHLEPTEKIKRKVVYDGQVIFEHHPDETGAVQSTVATIKTNVNVVVLTRPFFLQAKIRKNGDLQGIPPLPKESLP